jgi:hypothetical protein
MSAGKNHIFYSVSDDCEEKVWSGYASRPEQEKTPPVPYLSNRDYSKSSYWTGPMTNNYPT